MAPFSSTRINSFTVDIIVLLESSLLYIITNAYHLVLLYYIINAVFMLVRYIKFNIFFMHSHTDGISCFDMSHENFFSHGVLDLDLYRPFLRPRSILAVVSFFRQLILYRRPDFQRDIHLFLASLLQIFQKDRHDLSDIFFGQRMEDDDVVDPVQKFW